MKMKKIHATMMIVAMLFTASVMYAYSGGSGTESDPFLISTPEDVSALIQDGATSGKFYKLTKDLSCITPSSTKTFAGTFDGNEKRLTIESNRDYGLFYAMTGTLCNMDIVVNGSTPESPGQYAGGITRDATNAIINNCTITINGNISSSSSAFSTFPSPYSYSGGVIGSDGKCDKCMCINYTNKTYSLIGASGTIISSVTITDFQ